MRPLCLVLFLALAACQTPDASRLDRSWVLLKTHPADKQAQAGYRNAVARALPRLLEHPVRPERTQGDFDPGTLSEVKPIRRARATVPGLHRQGVGLPVVAITSRAKSGDPNAPRSGFHQAATAVVIPTTSGPRLRLENPKLTAKTDVGTTMAPLAMNLEAPIDATVRSGPRLLDGLRYLLLANRFSAPSQLVFLEPYNPQKTPVVFVHGLMSTPRMWRPVIKQLESLPAIRDRYQFWFFYYPTGQPVPLSALQLREALDAARARHHVKKPMILVGHSMGGILSRAQVSQITAAEATAEMPWLARLPSNHLARRALIFEPRNDVKRVIFFNTPHRGSQMALSGIAGLGMSLIRLPSSLLNELEDLPRYLLPGGRGRLPTSIQGLSPRSAFLAALNARPPRVPHHTVLGDRGRGDSPQSSDGVVPYSSAHLDSARSEVIVPGNHGSFTRPEAIRELERILLENQ